MGEGRREFNPRLYFVVAIYVSRLTFEIFLESRYKLKLEECLEINKYRKC